MDQGTSVKAPRRFYGLDGVRATAMLLGVFYHLPISMYQSGMGFAGMGGGGSPKQVVDDWLHSFRMPLFFLISGFFAHMMLQKYGLWRYLKRRWWRIGLPLFVTLFLLAGYRYAAERHGAAAPFGAAPAGIGVPAMPGGFGAAAGPVGQTGGQTGGQIGGQPAGAPGVAPNPWGGSMGGGFPGAGAPQNGTPPAAPWGGFGGPGFQFGQPGVQAGGVPPTWGGGFPGAPAPQAGAAAPAGNVFAALPGMPAPPSRAWSERLFGDYARFLTLEHLWFLWYLLVFVTIAPPIAAACGAVKPFVGGKAIDACGRWVLSRNAFGVLLAALTFPALLLARNPLGPSLANPQGFLGAFPDFLFQFYPDQPYYLLCFLIGWWLYRRQDSLDDLASYWLWNLALGVVAFAASRSVAGAAAAGFGVSPDQSLRETLIALALYCLGASLCLLGFVGFFQRFLDRPSSVGRYMADTALWVYLVHLPLIPYLIWWVQPSAGPWWAASLAGMAVVTGVALVLYELLVRPTPLKYLYGPTVLAKPRRAEPIPTAERLPASAGELASG